MALISVRSAFVSKMSTPEDDLRDLLGRINGLSAAFGGDFDLSVGQPIVTTLRTLAEMLPVYRQFVSLLEVIHKVEHG